MDKEMQRLLQEKMKQINRYLIRLGADRNDADDVVQDAVYKGLLYIDSIDPVVVEDAEEPEVLLLQKEKREEIDRVMEELPALHRQLLIMKYELDLSYQEISGLLGIKADLVKTYLYRARKQFQKKFGRNES